MKYRNSGGRSGGKKLGGCKNIPNPVPANATFNGGGGKWSSGPLGRAKDPHATAKKNKKSNP